MRVELKSGRAYKQNNFLLVIDGPITRGAYIQEGGGEAYKLQFTVFENSTELQS